MGGKVSQEFMFESPFGEDTLAICDKCAYAANLDVASSVCDAVQPDPEGLTRVHTPGKRTIEEVAGFLGRPSSHFAKSLAYASGGDVLLVVLRGDHELNETKLQAFLHTAARPAHPEEILATLGVEPGFIGPVRPKSKIRILADLALRDQLHWITGANEKDYHFTGVQPGRDCEIEEYADFRCAAPGDACGKCGAGLRVVHAIELGHIFKLGVKYSSAMKANFLDAGGRENPAVMGSYGIGIERILAAAIEQGNDEKGIIWNRILTPYHVHIIPVKIDNPEIVKLAERLHGFFRDSGLDCLIDDRPVSPGYKFKDADLIGVPIQVIIGEKWLKEGLIEIKERKTGGKEFIQEKDLPPYVQRYYSD
jgi:prolyl-tRNA synthetase